jgi:hypothetical protein
VKQYDLCVTKPWLGCILIAKNCAAHGRGLPASGFKCIFPA